MNRFAGGFALTPALARSLGAVAVIAVAVIAGAAGLVGPAAAHGRAHRPTVVLNRFQEANHPGEQVTAQGRARHLPKGAKVGLQERPGTSGPWAIVARTRPAAHGGFTLRWTVPPNSAPMIELRVVALHRGRVLAKSAPQTDALAPPPTGCAPPPKPGNIPAGDGVVQGGLYWEGGPPPGQGPNCWSSSYTVSATNNDTDAVTRQTVGAGQSYTLILPAGSYALSSEGCHGSATVTAGQFTKADVTCLYP